jgi:cell division protein FtsW
MSTAVIIFITAGTMFFLAGARLFHLLVSAIIGGVIGVFVAQNIITYGSERVSDFWAGITDITQANYQTLQARIAFANGGWFGVGLGQSSQTLTYSLPATHTDSIFAVIGEEWGILGATVVVALYVVLAIRGFQIARRAQDPFGALLATGITIWIVAQAQLNVAVMLGLVPSTGLPLPFISFGGSSLVVLMAGVGLLLCIQRATIARQYTPERRNHRATHDRRGGDGRTRVPSPGRSRSATPTQVKRR